MQCCAVLCLLFFIYLYVCSLLVRAGARVDETSLHCIALRAQIMAENGGCGGNGSVSVIEDGIEARNAKSPEASIESVGLRYVK